METILKQKALNYVNQYNDLSKEDISKFIDSSNESLNSIEDLFSDKQEIENLKIYWKEVVRLFCEKFKA